MKFLKNLFLLFIIIMPSVQTASCSALKADTGLGIRAPDGLLIKADRNTSDNYLQTQCLDFHKKHKNVGMFCVSSNKDFITDFGIIITPQLDGVPERFRVATGMSTYEMQTTTIHGHNLFIAEVDCDDGEEPLYRATSTCHVAFMPLEDGYFAYSNFILRSNVTRTPIVNTKTIMSVWRSFNIAPRIYFRH